MVKLYKDWYLNADDKHYAVGKASFERMDGKMVLTLQDAKEFPTAAEAVLHVFETEVREKVSKPDLLELAEFNAICSDLADELAEKFETATKNPKAPDIRRYDPYRDVETRSK